MSTFDKCIILANVLGLILALKAGDLFFVGLSLTVIILTVLAQEEKVTLNKE